MINHPTVTLLSADSQEFTATSQPLELPLTVLWSPLCVHVTHLEIQDHSQYVSLWSELIIYLL